MLRLRAFGGLWLEGPDGPVNGTATRRRLALLTLVAAAGKQGLSRDRVLAFLWSESDEDRGRHALAQTVYSMRRDFDGAPPIVGTADLRLNPEALSADVCDFEAALAAGDTLAAGAVYAGPFLDGFHLSDAPEFERWVEERRGDYARRAGRVFEMLAEEASEQGNHPQSVEWWRKLAVLDPYSARVALQLMTALSQAGDRAGALAYARIYSTRFREEVGAEPDQSVTELADALAKSDGPSAIPRPWASRGAPASTAPVPGAGPKPSRRLWRLPIAGAFTGLLVVLSAASFLRGERVPFNERDWMVLADLENLTGDSLLDRTLVTAAAAGLGQSRYINLFPANRVRETLRRMRADTLGTLDEALAREVAVREGLRGVLVLGVGNVADVYALNARFLDPESGRALGTWTREAVGEDRLLPALDRLLSDVRRGLGESRTDVAENSRPLPAVTTSSLEALRYFADGANAWAEGRWQEAQDLWHGAVRLDSSFARAHQALGSLSYWLDDRTSGDAHFAQALARVDRLPERERRWIEARIAGSRGDSHTEAERWRAYLELYPDDRDALLNLATSLKRANRCGEAIAPFEAALTLDPEMAEALINLAICFESLGRHAEGIAAFDSAFVLRPEDRTRTAGDINRIYGFLLLKSGDPARARAVFTELLAGDPVQRANGFRSLALLDMYDGRYDQAIAHLREAILLNRAARHGLSEYRNRMYLVMAYAAKGRDAAVWSEIAAAGRLADERQLPPTWTGFLLRHYARTGQLEEAERLRAAMEQRMNLESTMDRSALENARGEIALAAGRHVEAIDAFELAYRLTPEPYHLEPLARALHLTGEYSQAALRYETLIARHPLGWEPQEAWVMAHYQLGRIHEELGDTPGALRYYQQLLALWDEGDPDLVALGDARRRLAVLMRNR